MDILEDGGLDLPDAVLGRLDLVIGAVHSKLHLSRAQQTRRILKAMDHPHFSILAHPTGRLIDEREPYDLDMARVIRHARDRGLLPGAQRRPRAPGPHRHPLPDGPAGGGGAGQHRLRRP